MAVIKILHFSDVHLEDGFDGVPWQSFANKRLLGLANLRLHRGPRFAEAANKVASLAEFADAHDVDLALCTGDYTALGTDPELAYAREVVDPLTRRPLGFFTVPGNHDIYLSDSENKAWFDKHFGEFLVNDLPEYACDGPWPQVRLLSDGIALIGINSARPNPSLALSSGRIPDAQLEALEKILADPRIKERFVVIATHYAPRLESGKPDRPQHGLENADALLRIADAIDRGVIVHGHVHWRYHVQVPECSAGLFCAGSTTHAGREGLWLFEIGDDQAKATPGRWDQTRYVLEPDEAVVLVP